MPPKLAEFKDFMSFAVLFNNLLGIEPYQPIGKSAKSSRWLFFYFLLSVGNLSIVLIQETTFLVLSFKEPDYFIQVTMTLTYIGYSFVGQLKILTVWWQKPKLSKFLQELDFIFPSQNAAKQQEYRVHEHLSKIQRISRIFSVLHSVLITAYNFFAIAQFIVQKYVLQDPIERRLPYIPSVPWNWHDHWSFYLLYFSQAYAGYTTTWGHISSDLLIFSAVSQVIMHYDYLARTLEHYKVQAMRVPNGADLDMQHLRNMIIYHNKLLGLTDVMNGVFGVPLFINFFTSSVLVCFTGFQITVGVNTELCVKVVLFLTSSIAEIFLISSFSQRLVNASGSVVSAVYNMDWLESNLRFRKMLILILYRAQKPVYLKATVFLNVSMLTMTEVCEVNTKLNQAISTLTFGRCEHPPPH